MDHEVDAAEGRNAHLSQPVALVESRRFDNGGHAPPPLWVLSVARHTSPSGPQTVAVYFETDAASPRTRRRTMSVSSVGTYCRVNRPSLTPTRYPTLVAW